MGSNDPVSTYFLSTPVSHDSEGSLLGNSLLTADWLSQTREKFIYSQINYFLLT